MRYRIPYRPIQSLDDLPGHQDSSPKGQLGRQRVFPAPPPRGRDLTADSGTLSRGPCPLGRRCRKRPPAGRRLSLDPTPGASGLSQK